MHRGKSEATTGRPGRKERLEEPVQHKLADAMSGIGNRDAHVASRGKIPMAEWPCLSEVMDAGFKHNGSGSVHGLGGIVTKVEDDLLQLPALTDNDGSSGVVMNGQV